jgi:hypothetical protein
MVPPHESWSPQERWAWENIIRGEIADLARFDPAADHAAPDWWRGRDDAIEDAPDPQKLESFQAHQVLTELFLRSVIFHEPYASAPERPGVRIRHAVVKEAINWSSRRTKGELWLDRCHFAHDVLIQDLHVAGTLSFNGAAFGGALNADRLEVKGGLFCSNGFNAKGDVRLLGALIGGDAAFVQASLGGALNADRLEVKGGLFCRDGFRAEGDLRLVGARIGGNAELSKASLGGALVADGFEVKGDLFCRDGFNANGDVRLVGARIGGDAAFTQATLGGALKADRLEVKGDLFLRQMKGLGAANLVGATIGGTVQLWESTLTGPINFTGARITEALELEQGDDLGPVWRDGAKLILRNASVGALAGVLGAFRRPGQNKMPGPFVAMDLVGLRYQHLGGLQAKPGRTLADAKPEDLIAWLKAGIADEQGKHNAAFTPGPFRTLAQVLETSGHTEAARRIRIAMRQHERACTPWTSWRKWGLFIAGAVTGFSQRNHRAIYWFGGVVLASAALGLGLTGSPGLAWTPEALEHTFQWLWFALGNAVPLITLDEGHKNFLALAAGAKAGEPAPTWLAAWFYSAKILGFLILTYLAASLSGVATKGDE